MRHSPPPRSTLADVALAVSLALLPATGCASKQTATTTDPAPAAAAAAGDSTRQQRPVRPQRTRADLITREEIERTNYSNAYEVVEALRNNWLLPRGTDTFLGKPGEVRVRLDNSEFGGVERLREIPATNIAYLRFVDPVDAAGRWGIGYGHGAIHVVLRTR